MAPEAIGNKYADTRADLWSFGCFVAQLVCGWPPFKGGSDYLTFLRVQARRDRGVQSISARCTDAGGHFSAGAQVPSGRGHAQGGGRPVRPTAAPHSRQTTRLDDRRAAPRRASAEGGGDAENDGGGARGARRRRRRARRARGGGARGPRQDPFARLLCRGRVRRARAMACARPGAQRYRHGDEGAVRARRRAGRDGRPGRQRGEDRVAGARSQFA